MLPIFFECGDRVKFPSFRLMRESTFFLKFKEAAMSPHRVRDGGGWLPWKYQQSCQRKLESFVLSVTHIFDQGLQLISLLLLHLLL